MSYVSVTNISKSFDETRVLNNISFKINKGEFLTLLGPSGCGKSTLLKSIAGLNDFDNGSIVIDEKNITNVKAKDRNVGMVFQSYALFPNMTVYENIAFGLKIKKLSKSNIHKKVKEILEVVDLNGKENNYPSQLSGGQQQRVALARAIVLEPKVLLLDEPLSALDAKIRKSLQKQIRQIQQRLNMTTIFVTHDQEEAMIMSDKIIVMEKGKIAQEGSPDQIYKSPANEFVARFIGSYNVYSCEETKMLLGVYMENGIAIRPEVIEMSKELKQDEDYYSIEGRIRGRSMQGNVIRYEVYKDNIKILVDILNNNTIFNINEKIFININAKDIVIFGNN